MTDPFRRVLARHEGAHATVALCTQLHAVDCVRIETDLGGYAVSGGSFCRGSPWPDFQTARQKMALHCMAGRIGERLAGINRANAGRGDDEELAWNLWFIEATVVRQRLNRARLTKGELAIAKQQSLTVFDYWVNRGERLAEIILRCEHRLFDAISAELLTETLLCREELLLLYEEHATGKIHD